MRVRPHLKIWIGGFAQSEKHELLEENETWDVVRHALYNVVRPHVDKRVELSLADMERLDERTREISIVGILVLRPVVPHESLT